MNRLAEALRAWVLGHAGKQMTTSPRPDTTAYEILVRGDLSEGLVADLGARCFAPRQGTTLMVLDVIDQAHLQGVLASLHDHNVVIERVNPI